MKKRFAIFGMAMDMTPEGVDTLKRNVGKDLVDREIRIITGALYIQEFVVDQGRGVKQPFLIIGMAIDLKPENAQKLKDEIRKWLPDHEVRFITYGLCATEIEIEVAAGNANQNGYL